MIVSTNTLKDFLLSKTIRLREDANRQQYQSYIEWIDAVKTSINAGDFEYWDNSLKQELVNVINEFYDAGIFIIDTPKTPSRPTNSAQKKPEISNIDVDKLIEQNISPIIKQKTDNKEIKLNEHGVFENDKPNIHEKSKETARNTKPTYIIGNKSTGLGKEIARKLVEQAENTVISDIKNIANTKPTYKDSKLQAKPDYIPTEQDKKTIQDIQLPENKLYIYYELKSLFGNRIKEGVYAYGINNFCRYMEKKYPAGYKKTEIKNVISRILDYLKYINNKINEYEKND